MATGNVQLHSEEFSAARELEFQETYRSRVKAFDELDSDLRSARTFQRIYLVSMAGAISLSAFLGYTVAVGLWNSQPLFARWVGLAIVLALWASMGRAAWMNRRDIVAKTGALRNALQDRQTAAARLPLDSPSALRIYRESALDTIEQYRKGSNKNRRVHNLFQAVIITGSIATSTLAAMNSGDSAWLRYFTAALSAFVGISAGITGYFKFRERGYNLQSTADEIEKHYNASQFMLDEYASSDPSSPLSETDRLRKFACLVERIKEEQRKRELQLEQSSSGTEDRSA
ncbi:DUF4231 domain-containing protein [Kitasatospora cineracea]|uniref:DUF4231 domain-containing protein n=1 Tax=Kitasatospora cineracea TaxID=88074 RepID=UPI0033CFD712